MTSYTISTIPTPILTRDHHDPGKDYPSIVRELRIAAGTPARHESRVRAVERALAQIVGWHSIPDIPDGALRIDLGEVVLGADDLRMAKLIAKLELHGIGGDLGVGRGTTSTSRMSWARSLGKGRRHAGDGTAWDAAIGDAFRGVGPEVGDVSPTMLVELVDVLPPEDLLWPQTYALAQAVDADDPDSACAWHAAAVRLAIGELLRGREAGLDPIGRDGKRAPWRDQLLAEASWVIEDLALTAYEQLPDDATGPRVEISGRVVPL